MKSKIILAQFGRSLRRTRLKRKLSQEELAYKAGLHRTYIGMIERAERNISLINMAKISKALEVSLSELVRGLHYEE